MTVTAAARRFDLMLARVLHDGTGLDEADTALEGARAVLRKHPELAASGAARVRAAERVLEARRYAAEADTVDIAARWAEIAKAAQNALAGLSGLADAATTFGEKVAAARFVHDADGRWRKAPHG